jgi:hypothetical protein
MGVRSGRDPVLGDVLPGAVGPPSPLTGGERVRGGGAPSHQRECEGQRVCLFGERERVRGAADG